MIVSCIFVLLVLFRLMLALTSNGLLRHAHHSSLHPFVLRESISEKISHSWVKGKKKLTVGSVPPREDDRRSGMKSIFHSFRICDYGIQIMERGKIIDYGSMNMYWDRLKNFDGTWNDLSHEFKPEFNALKTKFKLICPKVVN